MGQQDGIEIAVSELPPPNPEIALKGIGKLLGLPPNKVNILRKRTNVLSGRQNRRQNANIRGLRKRIHQQAAVIKQLARIVGGTALQEYQKQQR